MTRVTQGMLTSNSIRNISNAYKKLNTLENQLTTGKKINRPSDDPVTAMKGIRYRTEVLETGQYLDRNITEVNSWMDNADSTMNLVTESLQRIRELTLQGANDTYESNQRASIASEIEQIMEHIATLSNSQVNNKYIFNGTDTTNQPVDLENFDFDMDINTFTSTPPANPENYVIVYNGETLNYDTTSASPVFKFNNGSNTITIDNSDPTNPNRVTYQEGANPPIDLKSFQVVIANKNAFSTNNQNVNIEVMKGIKIPVNVNPANVFSSQMFGDIQSLVKAMKEGASGEQLDSYIGNIDTHLQNVITERSELGARSNRVEMIESRVSSQEITAKKIMSENEDIDAEKVIIELTSHETLLRASLSVGAKIMQPTLMDFLR